MKRKICFFRLFIFCSMVLLLSCGRKENTLRELIPDKTTVYIQAKNPGVLMENIDSFIDELGLKTLTGGRLFKEIFFTSLSSLTEGEIDEHWFDLKRPAGVAYIPPCEGSSKIGGFLIFLPADKKYTESIREMIGEKKEWDVGFFGGYAVVALQYDIGKEYPPAKTIDITKLKKYDDDSLSYYVNFSGIWKTGKREWEGFKKEFNSSIARSASAFPGDLQKRIINFYTGLLSLIEQIEEIDGSISTDARDLELRENTSFDETGEMAEFLKSLSPVENTGDFLKYLPADYLFSLVANMAPGDRRKLFSSFYNLIPQDMTDSSIDIWKEYRAIMAPYKNEFGFRASIAFDVDIDFEKIINSYNADAGPEVLPKSILDLLGFKMMAVYEAENPLRVKKILKDTVESGGYSRFADALLKKSGVVAEFSLEEKKAEGFTYDEFSMKLDFREYLKKMGAGTKSLDKINSILSNIFNFIRLYIGYGKNRVYVVIDKNGAEVMEKLIKNDSCPGGLVESSAHFSKTISRMPHGSHFVYQCSVKRIINIIRKIPDLNYISEITIPDAPGITGYVRAKDNRVETAMYFPVIELKRYIWNFFLAPKRPVSSQD